MARMQKPKKGSSKALIDEFISQSRQKALNLTYESSLKELDLILDQLQNESVPLEELQRFFLQGKIYLEHCESLLVKIEQEVEELDLDKFDLS